MNLAGELVLSRNQLVQQVGSDGTAELDSVAGRVDQVTSELQEAIMQTRMQVIGTVFGKFPRVVRDLSNQLGKQCQLTLEGEDVELDKSIIEAIGDPLTHLVRNSVDHGIESPEQRIAAGKPAAGAIVLRAFHQAGKVNIEKLGGAVGIDTRTGAGTTIHVKLPLTLAIIPSLIVRCRDDRFAIPQASINELVRLKAADVESRIERINDAEVFRLRGNLLPLVRLDGAVDVREKAESTGDEPVNIIVVETGQLQYGLVVDGLHDSEEIVVKPLGRHMQNCHCLAGATILGDGESR